MSEVAAESVATQTDAPVTPAPVETPAAPPQAMSKREARRSARAAGEAMDAARSKAEAARERAASQPRQDAGTPVGGQFKEGDRAEAATEPPDASVTTPQAATAPAEPGATTPEAVPTGPPDGFVRIELADGHPLREQGRTHYDVPASEERAWREAINGAARRKEVEAMQAQLAERDREVAELRRQQLIRDAEMRFRDEQGGTFWTADHEARYQDILQTYGQDDADAYKAGQLRKRDEAMAGVREQADLQAISERWASNGRTFLQEAHAALPGMFPGVTESEIETAIQMYAAELERVEARAREQLRGRMSEAEFARMFTSRVGYSEQDFLSVAGAYLQSRPGVVGRAASQQAAAELQRRQIEADVQAQEQERLRAASVRHAQNPERGLGTAAAPARLEPEDTKPDTSKMSADAIRKMYRQGARQAAEAVGQMARR